MKNIRYPLVDPNPPHLSAHPEILARIEASGVFSNNGPELQAFEAEATAKLFGGRGACLGVGNATLGLMLAIRQAIGREPQPGKFALIPAFTFAATAQAAEWAGLTPLLVDSDPDDWASSAAAEERLLEKYRGQVAVIVPYATFGNDIDLDRYAWLMRKYGVAVVVDAAASLGTIGEDGKGFGTDAPFPVVFSLHATKTFAVAEGGLIHCADASVIDDLRAMNNFGFQGARSATLPGMNAKMPEMIAAMARLKLAEIDAVADGRSAVEAAYRESLRDVTLQLARGERRAPQFMSALLPADLADRRDRVIALLAEDGIGCGTYFSPHLGQQPWIRDHGPATWTPVADDIARRIISLPISDRMTPADACYISARVNAICASLRTPAQPRALDLMTIIGGGPACTAILTSASKVDRLKALAQSGLTVVERDDTLGGGRLGNYVITSDTSAETFLTALRDNPHPEIASLIDHPAARTVEKYVNSLGVPLYLTGPLLRAIGQRLSSIVSNNGGEIAVGHEAIDARRLPTGGWLTRMRRVSDGTITERRSQTIVVATGGYQPLDRLATVEVAGAPLFRMAEGKLLQSDEVLSTGGLERVADLLAGKKSPRVAVIGGSTSAVSAVALMLRSRPGIPFGNGGVTILHREDLHPFYPTADAAHADNFFDFGPDDICPVSGFVYRLGGFRLESRELVLRMLRINGREPEPRVALHKIAGDDDAEARRTIEQADLVIAALGYRPHALPLLDVAGQPIALATHAGRSMVDRYCRVVDANDQPVPGAFGVGLAAGFVPWGKLGGEASFRGQANNLWLWQNDVGHLIIDQVLDEAQRAVA